MSGLQDRVLHDPQVMERLLLDLSINVTSMFRDPTFFAAFREKVVPLLRTYPFLRIWNAGCSTGEETFSLAILLARRACYDRTRIYATDINEESLERARRARSRSRRCGTTPPTTSVRRRARVLRATTRDGDRALRPGLGDTFRVRTGTTLLRTARSTSST